ncbi:hypothetical protein DFS34DRAFT_612195 [Phlyctochytrium arcticum]|nr:hypothetical protein DFS34DRAFT_612195 [Phlyctochytrium arcticum]
MVRRSSRAAQLDDSDLSGEELDSQEKENTADKADEDSENAELSDEDQENSPNKRVKLANGKEGKGALSNDNEYPVGSILRIRLSKFITYDFVEFFPGPNLNMIIGPNGTGKSSLVCAIALGLAGRPENLGRQKTLQDFIKENESRSSIEIELKTKGQGRNLTIKRIFKRGMANKSHWKMNGEPATQDAVTEKLAAMNVQVNNLCSFLPQEKVSEFAQMNPPELLRETERAAGSAKLSKWHDELVELRNEEKDANSAVESLRRNVENLEQRNAVVERDVARYREREAVLQNTKNLRMKIPWCQYEIARTSFLEARSHKNELQQALEELQLKHTPLQQHIDDLKAQMATVGQEVKRLTRAYHEQTTSSSGLAGKIEEIKIAEANSDRLHSQLEGLQRKEKERQKRINNLRQEISKEQSKLESLEREMTEGGGADGSSQGGSQQELAQLQDEINRKNRVLEEIGGRIMIVQRKMREVQEDAARFRDQKETTYRELQSLDDIREQKLHGLRQTNRQTYDATLWLRENQHLFEKKVFEPVVLEISVKDPKYCAAVESGLSRSLMTFVTLTEADYFKFDEEVLKKRKWRVDVVMFEPKTLSMYRPKFSLEQIQSWGFDGYLLDMVDGPPEVLVAACEKDGIHNLPIASGRVQLTDDVERRIGAYISQNVRHKVNSAYGQSSSRATTLRPARILTRSVDNERRRELEMRLDELHTSMEECAQRLKAGSIEEEKIRKEDSLVREQKQELVNRKKQIQQRKIRYDKAKQNLEIQQMRLQTAEEEPSIETEELAVRKQIHACNLQRCQLALEFKTIQFQSLNDFRKRTIAALRQVELEAKITEQASRKRESDDELRVAQQALANAADQVARSKERARRKLEAAREAVAGASEQERDTLAQMWTDKTLDELEEMLVEQEARAEMINSTDAGVITEYEKRNTEIEALKAKIAKGEGKLNDRRGRIQSIKDKWVPELTELVNSISKNFADAFDKIGCAGEVRIAENDDFDKWGIDILVKFRDTEKLHHLTGQRQSGGERSVSTILYLMALQELSHVPFRVVDEINQGMDPRNERMVHGEMVRAACQAGTSQYFLITPKLLPDLEYHERMRVLCVFNGPFTVEKVDSKDYLKRKIAATGAKSS